MADTISTDPSVPTNNAPVAPVTSITPAPPSPEEKVSAGVWFVHRSQQPAHHAGLRAWMEYKGVGQHEQKTLKEWDAVFAGY